MIQEEKEIEMKSRKVMIYKLKKLKFGKKWTIKVWCGGEIYIRALVRDIGQDLDSCV